MNTHSAQEKSTVTIKINGLKVTLSVDGRESFRIFSTPEQAGACYDHYKALINKVEKIS